MMRYWGTYLVSFVSGSERNTVYAHFISIHAGLGSSHLTLSGIKFAIISSFLVTKLVTTNKLGVFIVTRRNNYWQILLVTAKYW